MSNELFTYLTLFPEMLFLTFLGGKKGAKCLRIHLSEWRGWNCRNRSGYLSFPEVLNADMTIVYT